jgi:hypothetical protein
LARVRTKAEAYDIVISVNRLSKPVRRYLSRATTGQCDMLSLKYLLTVVTAVAVGTVMGRAIRLDYVDDFREAALAE